MATGSYEGDLRTTLVHQRSGQSFVTDAPVDNQGKGQAFSPTDLVAAALSSCMATIMGIKARALDVDLRGLQWEVEKIMLPQPRRIAEVRIRFHHPHLAASEDQKQLLREAALSCPVALSLSDQVRQTVMFDF